MPNIAIYGGAFNPPTKAHEAVVAACLQHEAVDEVWVMPSADRFDKQFTVAARDRVAMLEMFVAECRQYGRVALSRVELEQIGPPTETGKTARFLREVYPTHDFRFVFGADAYNSMEAWDGGLELKSNLPMLVVVRGSEPIKPGPNVEVLPAVVYDDVSSTQVREACVNGGRLDDFVLGGVARYIAERKLYTA